MAKILTPSSGSAEAPDVCVGDLPDLTDGGYNVASDDSCDLGAGTSAVANPLFGDLADNSRPTLTMLPAAGGPVVNIIPSGFAVRSASSDGSSNASIRLCGTGVTDQRGAAHPAETGIATWHGVIIGTVPLLVGAALTRAARRREPMHRHGARYPRVTAV